MYYVMAIEGNARFQTVVVYKKIPKVASREYNKIRKVSALD